MTDKKIIKDTTYGDAPRHIFDAYLPRGRNKNTKAVILIPGGGWIGGDKSGFNFQAELFCDSGVSAFTMNYRYADFCTGITYVEMLEDIDRAIEFIISQSDEFIFSPENICLFGHSAGGHLALLYTYRNNQRKRVDKVVSVAGISDITDTELFKNSDESSDPVLNILVGSNEKYKWNDASPINHIGNTTTYLYHGTLDDLVPYRQSERLFRKIKNLSKKNRYILFEGDDHSLNVPDFTTIVAETVDLIK